MEIPTPINWTSPFKSVLKDCWMIFVFKFKYNIIQANSGDPEASSTMRALQRVLVSVIIIFLNDSERSLNKKWLRPVTNKSTPPLVGNQSENAFPSISYIRTKKHTSTILRA